MPSHTRSRPGRPGTWMPVLPLLLPAALVLTALLGPGALRAQEIKQVTIGELMVHNAVAVVQAAQQAVGAKAEFNAEMDAARAQFFTTLDSPAKHKAAEVRLAGMLHDKDIFYMGYCVVGGVDDAMARLGGIAILTGQQGRMIGDGIPKPAMPAFRRWINAVRTSLGARTDSELLVYGEAQLGAALEKNVATYAAYKSVRDAAEYHIWLSTHPGNLQTPGQIPLKDQNIYGVYSTAILTFSRDEAVKLRKLGIEPAQQLLLCAFGPTYAGDGSERFSFQIFWYRSAPADIDRLLSIDAEDALRTLGKQGYEQCPATDGIGTRWMEQAALVAADPRYAVTRASARQELQAQTAQKDKDFAVQRQLDDLCAKASEDFAGNWAFNDGPTRRELKNAYGEACHANPDNRAADKVSADMHAICKAWDDHLNAVSLDRTDLQYAVMLKSNQAHCGVPGGDYFAGTPTRIWRGEDSSRPALQDGQDAHARTCAVMFRNVVSARARAHGLSEWLGVKRFEATVQRQCGSLPP